MCGYATSLKHMLAAHTVAGFDKIRGGAITLFVETFKVPRYTITLFLFVETK